MLKFKPNCNSNFINKSTIFIGGSEGANPHNHSSTRLWAVIIHLIVTIAVLNNQVELTSVQVSTGGVRGLDVATWQWQASGVKLIGHLHPVQLQHGGRYLHFGLIHNRSALHAQCCQQVPLCLAGVLERGSSARRSRRFAAHYA